MAHPPLPTVSAPLGFAEGAILMLCPERGGLGQFRLSVHPGFTTGHGYGHHAVPLCNLETAASGQAAQALRPVAAR
jgi:hypothetical protein